MLNFLSCTTIRYNSIYAKWLKDPGSLLDFAEYDPNTDRLLDLCGGTGAISIEAVHRGAKNVVLADLNPRCSANPIIAVQRDVNKRGSLSDIGKFDLVVIRQALGYLDLRALAENLEHVLSDKGRVVFNTFLKPRGKVGLYKHQLCWFAEASVPMFRRVIHFQGRLTPNFEWDLSAFKWHSPADIAKAFSGMSLVKYAATDTSSRYLYSKDPTSWTVHDVGSTWT